MKALQLFSEESLERGAQMSPDEILRFLEEFRLRYADRGPDPSNDKAPEPPTDQAGEAVSQSTRYSRISPG